MSARGLIVALAGALTAWTALPLASIALVAPAAADPLEDVARARIDASLPSYLAIADLHLAARLASLDVDAATVNVAWPRAPRAGTASVQLTWGKHQSRFVPVTLAAMIAVPVAVRTVAAGELIGPGDVVVEERPIAASVVPAIHPVGQTATADIAAGAVIDGRAVSRPAPIARGTAVTVEVRRGSVRITGRGVLERAARPGEDALVRVAPDRPAVRGTLIDAQTVVVGELGDAGARGVTP
jgi:flagella basal body P-ring formation protein FlgA